MFVIDVPFNSLSFGQVSFNLLREFWRRGVDVSIFPVGGKTDWAAYGDLNPDFKSWLESALDPFGKFSRDDWTFRLWHLNGSHTRTTARQALLSYYECSSPTETERAIAGLQDKMLFGSQYAASQFDGSEACPLGFDEDIKPTNKTYLEGKVHFGLMGKFEKRKHTAAIIKTWLAKYGNNPDYALTCCITNPFLKPEQMQQIVRNLMGETRYTNINFLPYLQTNAEVNEFLNAIDIDLTGLSGGEGWNLPAFNATCLGKWSLVLNATSHKDWATAENSFLIEPDGTMPAPDGLFFQEGGPFNQGDFYTFSPEQVVVGMEEAAKKVKAGETNEAGLTLPEKFSYSRMADQILSSMED